MRTAVVALAALVVLGQARADEAGLAFFETDVRPALVKHCYPCHSHEAGKARGGLSLDHRDGLRKGGDSGPAVVPGKPDQSLLIKAVRHEHDSLKMPPRAKLPPAVIRDLERWVRDGAIDPRDKPSAAAAESWAETLRRRSGWWSLKPVRRPAVPTPADAARSDHPVDRFLLARLEARGLTPAVPADPRTLARRLGLVLTGLPPTAELISAFLAECDRAGCVPRPALEKLIDSLLASPHFGERWARHWMDVVRFSETHGNEWNYEVHHAWRYRDYLIRAFNDDLPYDQLVREHVAGDLLPRPRWNRHGRFNESIIGTAFYRFGEVNHDDCISLPQIGYDLADNQIDTVTKAFQATTVACARCHDHKLDAVSAEDYYALLGVLRSSRMVSHCIDSPEVNAAERRRLEELKKELRRELARVWLAEVPQVARYMQAAQAQRARSADAADLAKGLDPEKLTKWAAALAMEKQPLEDPLSPWRLIGGAEAKAFPAEWQKLDERFRKEDRERADFNRARFTTWADFRTGDPNGWQVGGQGLTEPARPACDFVVHPAGERVVRAVLPAGRYTHALSDKLNGTLRSPTVPPGKAHVSFQVVGERSSAVRLVSNNCQLNYKNYRALASPDWQWVTFSPPAEREQLRTYAELMTMFDNPKFPDQLSALGGDPANYKLPWEKAAENPRSYFGVTRAVLHDDPEPPKPELGHLRGLFAEPAPATPAELAARHASLIEASLRAWAAGKASDDDARWLDALLGRELLGNLRTQSPRLAELVRQYRQTEGQLSLPRVVPGVADGDQGIQQPVFVRGDLARPGKPVPRRYLEVLSRKGDEFRSTGSGRLELAERLAGADNPLTARVMVNRVWHHLFGTGLVRTVDDFGHVGETPSHPQLLDYLADRFVADGWSVKRLIRSLVLTRAFQASSRAPAARDLDPQNRLLHHYPARRMEAEAIRDSILAVSGRLSRELFGPSVQPFREKEYADRRLFPGPLDGDGRRSVYVKNNLMEGPRFLSAFNFPGGKVTQGRRDVTNVPAQALALLNDPFVLQQADVWAGALVARPAESLPARIDALFQTALHRPPSAAERDRFVQTVGQLAELHQVRDGEVMRSRAVWKDVAHSVFNLSEFVYIP